MLLFSFVVFSVEMMCLYVHCPLCYCVKSAQTTDGPKIAKIDPSHPTLRGFEIDYRWESVQEEDFGLGVVVMFTSCLVGFVVLFLLVICNSDLVEMPGSKWSNGKSPRARPNR